MAHDLESIIGRSHYELFPDLPLHLKQSHQRGFAGLVQKCEEDKLIYPDGSQQWFRWEVHPWYRSNGDVGGIIVFSDNITDRKQAELTLEETQEKLQLFIKYAPASIVMFDRSMPRIDNWAIALRAFSEYSRGVEAIPPARFRRFH
ncbi:MAG: PAS domain S-box protein [Microcoleus sp. PH2017_13_LAR_U_A]|nr:PAS domain S-box protein [Microcoleus sp. PH2017_13_LAR_U_A]